MMKRFSTICMLFTALAILLGHDFIPHHHHHLDHLTVELHHSDHQHHGDTSDGNGENKDFDFGHLFSYIQHGENGIVFLNNHFYSNLLSKQLSPSTALLSDVFALQRNADVTRLYSPPYKIEYCNIPGLFLCGQRAPPFSII